MDKFTQHLTQNVGEYDGYKIVKCADNAFYLKFSLKNRETFVLEIRILPGNIIQVGEVKNSVHDYKMCFPNVDQFYNYVELCASIENDINGMHISFANVWQTIANHVIDKRHVYTPVHWDIASVNTIC